MIHLLDVPKLEKVKGKTAYCPILSSDGKNECHTLIFCNEVPASGNYPAKLQWQNRDGKAHYNFDFRTKTTTCRPEGEQTTEAGTEQAKIGVSPTPEFKIKELDMNDLAVKAELRHFEADMADFEMYETFIFKRYGNINPAKAGMIIKFLEERRKERLKE